MCMNTVVTPELFAQAGGIAGHGLLHLDTRGHPLTN